MEKNNVRNTALQMLIRTLEKGDFSHIVLAEIRQASDLDARDLSFLKRLYAGTLEKLVWLDYVLDQICATPLRKQKPVIRNILRMSLYQMVFMDSVPARAAINEAVKLTKMRGLSNLSGFVNGVLRNAERKLPDMKLPDYVQAACPLWLYQLVCSQYPKDAPLFFEALKTPKDRTYFRMNLRRFSEEDVLSCLQADGVSVGRFGLTESQLKDTRSIATPEKTDNMLQKATIGDGKGQTMCNDSDGRTLICDGSMQNKNADRSKSGIADNAWYFKEVPDLTGLTAFRKGMIIMQDPSSMQMVEAATLAAPDAKKVVDVCAAPGGKSLYLAELLPDAQIEARDLTSYKTGLIEDNIRRLQIFGITTRVRDATVLDEASCHAFDLVLADLPCSGLGVIRKKPDILYRLKPEDLPSLVALQRRILSVVQSYVKPGGVLVYSTCTINREENEENARWFLTEYPFTMEEERQLLPGRDPYDGFYYAVFRRKI